MSIPSDGKVIKMEKEYLFEVTKLDFTIRAAVTVIGKDLLVTLTGGDTPHIGTITAFSRETDVQTIRFPSHDGRFHKDDVLAQKIADIIKEAVPGSCTITSGVHVDHISNAQIQASFPMAETLGRKILDWLKQTDFQSKEPVYYKNGEKPL